MESWSDGQPLQSKVKNAKFSNINKMQEILIFSDILYIQAAHHVHSLAMEQGRWNKAASSGEIALAGFKKYYGERAGLVAALLVRIGLAYSKAGLIEKGLECVYEADSIYKVVPGEGSHFYKKDFKPILDAILDKETG